MRWLRTWGSLRAVRICLALSSGLSRECCEIILMSSACRHWHRRRYHQGESPGIRPLRGLWKADDQVAAPALLHEIAHPRLRATFGTCYYGFYHLGGFISGLMCSKSI
jgi:hypothetical protein